MKLTSPCRLLVPLTVGILLTGLTLAAQETKPTRSINLNYAQDRWFPNILAPYETPWVPEPRMSNSDRLHSLIREGKLHLSVQDIIALALENNLDLAVSRYTISYAQTDVLRTLGGGAARGFTGSFSSAALFSGAIGGGVSASGGGSGGRGGGVSGSAGATQLGGGTFDPEVFFSMGWDRNTSPLGTTAVTGVPYVTSQGTSYTTGYSQAFQTGTSFQVFTGGSRGTTTSLTPVFNPTVQTFLAMGFTQPLLNGYGRRYNSMQIRVAKNSLQNADSQFRQQVITTVSQILNLYWDLLSFKENVRVAEQSLALAQKLYSDNKRQVEIGTLAPIEVVRAESEVATNQQNLIVAQTSYQQQAEIIKTALSKQVDPEVAKAQIEADDKLPEPRPDDVPPLDEALRLAAANRPEIEQLEKNLSSQDYTIAARRNSLLPSLNVFASYIPTGLSGNQAQCPAGFAPLGLRCVGAGGETVTPLGIGAGGVSQAMTQTLRGNFPDYSFGVNLSIPIRNRAAQADAARALLERRQLQTQVQQTKNNIAQAVRNAEIGVVQAKARIEAAQKAVKYAQQTLDAEQKKFQLGESTPFLVIQAQRDLATAEGNEVTARSTYAKAVTALQQATAIILTKYNVEMNDAVEGKFSRPPNIPGTPSTPEPAQPPQS